MNKTEFTDRLQDGRVPLHLWGSDATQKIDYLVREIEQGRATIYRNRRGKLTFKCQTVGVNFMYQARNGFRLENQVLVRRSALPESSALFDVAGTSISVPKRPEEIPLVVAVRAIHRFFPFEANAKIRISSCDSRISGPMLTDVYPGLRMMNVWHIFSWFVSKEHYAAAGYGRKDSGDPILYRWLTLA